MGFLPKPRTRELVCDWDGLAPADGSEPLTCVVKANMTWDEIASLPTPTIGDGKISFPDAKSLREGIAPYVLGWNCDRPDITTGQVVPVLPPAEAGPAAFLAVDPLIGVWLGWTLRIMHRIPDGVNETDGNEKKSSGTEPSDPMPLQPPAESSSSPARPKSSRKNRKGSA